MSHIKDVLAHGFGNNTWKTDGKLLAMWYRNNGKKKSETLKLVKEKCELYCSAANGGSYNKTSSYRIVNSFVDKAYKKESDGSYKDNIREIREVYITTGIINWFLSLEDKFVISDERVEELKKRRPGIVIKKNRPMNFNRIKYLFTIYVWTLIKEQYLDNPNIIYLNDNDNKRRFRVRSDLMTGFNLSKERNLLYDLGFIDVNHGLGIIPKFKFENPVFEKSQEILKKRLDKLKDCDIIKLSGEDLYNNGYWLLKQRNGSFICQNCGKEFANYTSKTKGGKPRKYCKECAETINFNFTKKRYCIDCGKEITYEESNGTTGVKRKRLRCNECRIKHERERAAKNFLRVKPEIPPPQLNIENI